ncbi:hypothetical protein J8G26_11710 [Acidovorax sp. JG5]|jgi:hypothetical protein|uniref:hypothetical protein n=1 Tax=Acidovorax sp. JG5 TaxID=2822718 RepID=UPI001B31E4AF|nr:hypothetical protein [Acidovorax sp. JG5]MBP3981394.1 hypothetical protein [Acidovorax sp. JG5]
MKQTFLPIKIANRSIASIAWVVLCMTTASAHAELRLSCPVQWDQLNALRGADLNASVMGIKIRDWTPEYLEQVRRKSEECSRSGAGPESLRRAEHMDGVSRVYPAAKQFIAENTDRVQQEKTRDQIGSTVQQSDLKQVVILDGKGLPKSITIIYGPTGRATKTCDTLSGGIGYATAESYGQAVQFARMCQQVSLTSAATVSMLERQAAAVPALYKALDAFSDRAKQLGATANPAEGQLKELEAQQQKLSGQLQALQLPNNDEAFVAASKTVTELRDRAQTSACGDQAVKAGFPASWKANYILMEWNAPEPFCGLVQAAQRTGSQIRYLPAGLLGKEGFEVKSPKRTVQIFTQADRVPGGEPNVKMMIPVSAKIDGKSTDVTRNNLRAVAAELIAALRNQ